MNALRSKSNVSNIALLCVLIALVGYQSFANRPAGPSQNTIVATFDLERTFNSLEEKKAAFAEIPKLTEDLYAKGEEDRKALEQMKADLDLFPKGSPRHNELVDKLEMAVQKYRAYNEFSKLKIEAAQGRTLKRVYLNIRRAVQELAVANNYAVVFVDDSVAEIPPGTLEDLNRQISARRIVYTSVDITDDLINHMNQAFEASGGVAPSNAASKAVPKVP